MADALRLGTRDARLLFHAGMIHKALGDPDRARDYLGQALALNPRFHPIAGRDRRARAGRAEARTTARGGGREPTSPRASSRWARSQRPSRGSPRRRSRRHPLGNFSISHYAGIEIGADAVRIRYVVDMAEIPTFQEMQEAGLVAEAGHPSVAPWVARTVSALGARPSPRSGRRAAGAHAERQRDHLPARRRRAADAEARCRLLGTARRSAARARPRCATPTRTTRAGRAGRK